MAPPPRRPRLPATHEVSRHLGRYRQRRAHSDDGAAAAALPAAGNSRGEPPPRHLPAAPQADGSLDSPRAGRCDYDGGVSLVACVQLRSGPDIAANLARVDHWVGKAAAHGAVLVATPENTTLLTSPERKVALAEALDGPTHLALGEIARRHGVWLLVGSVAEACAVDARRCHNTSVLYDSAGTLVAHYRKLHLFDIDLADGTHFRESAHIAPGDDVVVADTPVGLLGLSICYDLRFPELYRRLVDAGAELISVPSAFTLTTGRDHWHALLRARAIEAQAYVLAPAQEGPHRPGRHSYGHSLIVDPWGPVLADCADGEGVVLGEVDLGRVAEVRRGMPVGGHRRL